MIKRIPIFVFLSLLASSCLAQVTLDIEALGDGRVRRNPQPDSLGFYVLGVTVTLVGLPARLWLFSDWSVDVISTNDTVQVVMNADKNVTATFKKGKLLFVRDESKLIVRLSNRVSEIFEKISKVRGKGEEIVLDDTTVVFAPFQKLGGPKKTKIRNKLIFLLDEIQVKADTIKVVVTQ